MDQILYEYYQNNAKKLYSIVDKILLNFGGISNKDYDYFYVVASDLFTNIYLNNTYDSSKGNFDKFLYSCLFNKIKSEITKRNRIKRRADRMSISIDTPIRDDENLTLGDTIAGDFDVEMKVLEESEKEYSNKMMLYLSKLSNTQKEILKLNITGYHSDEIIRILHITEKEYADCYAAIHSYKNVSVLF